MAGATPDASRPRRFVDHRHGPQRPSAPHGRVPRRRRRDQRSAGRGVRADRGRCGARRRGRAPRPLRLAGAGPPAVDASHRALHRDHAGHGPGCARSGRRAGRVVGDGARPGPRRPQRELRSRCAAAGVRARADAVDRSADAVHRGDGPALRTSGDAARPGAAGRHVGHRRRGGPPRAPGRRDLRADLLRAVRPSVRAGRDGGRGGRIDGAAPSADDAARVAGGGGPPRARERRAIQPRSAGRGGAGPRGAAGGSGRLPLPRRARHRALRREVAHASGPGRARTWRPRPRPRTGCVTPPSSTPARPGRSSAPWSWRTG